MEIFNTACFIGHRTIKETEELKIKLCEIIETLIVSEKVDTFLFGSKSQFDGLCLELLTKLKEKHPHIKRVYVRAEYPVINENYKAYILKYYDDTYYPKNIIGATKSVYIKRNYEMIDNSKFCIVYCERDYSPNNRKSGTKIALEYALKHKKIIFKLPK